MQLCFAPELTNCTYEKVTNDKCDKGCNNDYCSNYQWGGNFENPRITSDNQKADNFMCLVNTTTASSVESNLTCIESSVYSKYVDPNIEEKGNWDGICEVCFHCI